MELQSALLDLRVVLCEDQRSFVYGDHVLLEVFEGLETDRWLAVCAPQLNVRVYLDYLSFVLFIFGNNVIEELHLVVITAVSRCCLLLASGLPKFFLLRFGSCLSRLSFLSSIIDGLGLLIVNIF